MAAIILEGISKRFPDGTEALQRMDLHIADGEFFILVGPSGCGKSTLLNIIAGLAEPTTGEVRVDGRVVTALDPGKRNMAMVFQSYAIYPHMTVRENIAFPLRIAKLPAAEIAARVQEAAAMLELQALLDRRPAELSGGQRQRVAMGRAIVRRPAAFLLDEPLSNLDARLRVQMRAELARLQQRLVTTTVYVTHDQTEAMTLGQRVAVLWQGRIQQVGTPRELYQRPANLFVAGFVGSPAMNFLPARIAGGRLVLPVTEIPLRDEWQGQPGGEARAVIAGIRPEQIRKAENGEEAGVFDAPVEMVEWLGADQYVHFDLEIAAATHLEALSGEAELTQWREGCVRLVARVGAGSRVAAGDVLRLCIEGGISLFDPGSGVRIAR